MGGEFVQVICALLAKSARSDKTNGSGMKRITFGRLYAYRDAQERLVNGYPHNTDERI